MTPMRVRSLSLRVRIMAIIIGGAILPLALLGLWLTTSAARSGRNLLRQELQASVTQIGRRIEERWQNRAGDLALLAGNEPVRRMLGSATLDLETGRYLQDVAQALRGSIREFSYRDTTGRILWSSSDAARVVDLGEPRVAVAGFNDLDALLVRRPVPDAEGKTLGTMEARVLLSAMLPTDSLQLIVAGAALRILNRETGEEIGGPLSGRPQGTMVATRASLADPPLDLELAASDARYVRPFAEAARLGFGFLLVVAVLALVLTAFLTRRLTASLTQMADAAGAVAAGDMERSVAGEGSDEVGRLAMAFNTMTESLRRTLRDLARGESLAAVGRFAAAISHEVKNALTAVRLDLQRLAERTTSADDGAMVQRMLGNVRRLDSIVTGSLRIARTDPATMRSVVLEGVVRAALTAAEPVFREHGAEAALQHGDQDSIRVRGDAGALEQMFLNLLMNAAQAMTPGGVARVTICRSGELAAVRIADTGRGIAPEILARLGEPFLSSRAEGTGLGYSIARQIAVGHGGDVTVVSTSSTGTTVEVSLP